MPFHQIHSIEKGEKRRFDGRKEGRFAKEAVIIVTRK